MEQGLLGDRKRRGAKGFKASSSEIEECRRFGLKSSLVQFAFSYGPSHVAVQRHSLRACPAGGASYQSAAADADPLLSSAPVAVRSRRWRIAVIFRFGVVVFFDVAAIGQTAFVAGLRELVTEPVDHGEFETLEFVVAPGNGGCCWMACCNSILMNACLQVVADVWPRRDLDHHERLVASSFDRVEPLAEQLSSGRHRIRQLHGLVADIGEMLRVQHRMVGRAEIGEKSRTSSGTTPNASGCSCAWNRVRDPRGRGALERKLNLISTGGDPSRPGTELRTLQVGGIS